MNWEAIGAVGEIAGAVAVVASLVYVSFQLKQNTAAIRGDRYHSINSTMINLYSDWTQSELVPGLMVRLAAPDVTLDSFSPEDQIRIRLMFQSATRMLEDIFQQVSEGNLPKSALEHLGSSNWFSQPIYSEVWAVMKVNYSVEFNEFMSDRYKI